MRCMKVKLLHVVLCCIVLSMISVWMRRSIQAQNSLCLFPGETEEKTKVKEVDGSLPWIYMVTPTYPRLEQIPDLTRLAQTLQMVPNLHWILVEDNDLPENPEIKALLTEKRIPFTYIVKKMPFKLGKEAFNRITGYEWVKDNVKEGIMYFGDDDNTYDTRIFEEMRYIKKVGMWPVGLVTKYGISTPVCKDGKVVGFYDGFDGGRKFRIDMAAFAVNIEYMLKQPRVEMNITIGYQESSFLESLNVEMDDFEPKAGGCTKVWVWHTQTVKEYSPYLLRFPLEKHMKGTNLKKLQDYIVLSNDAIDQTFQSARLMKQQMRKLWEIMGPEKDPRKKRKVG